MKTQTCPNCGPTKRAKVGQFDRHDPRCSNRERCDRRKAAKAARAEKTAAAK